MALEETVECEHENVNWNPVELEYQTDGTAAVWQEGRCLSCNALVQLNYDPRDEVGIIAGVDPEEDEEE